MEILCEQISEPTTFPSTSETLAHEISDTSQARRLSVLYLPAGALFTLWREGLHWYNFFKNQASEHGQFSGIVNGSVCEELMSSVGKDIRQEDS